MNMNAKSVVVALTMMLISSAAMAVNPAALLGGSSINNSRLDDLKAAQQVYQNLLDEHAREETHIKRLTRRLERAERKLEKAQFNVNKLRAELMFTRDIQRRQASELKVAGERLNRAWQAAYGTPEYRVAAKK
ncbi:hypothetical protein [Alysiella filiformis]|uniref:Uncharacterized protein n=1 Tax=Alysiella filiformis DSM 16848 TaxID=1120981 RepID=A0A286EM79_9NEIS|nr:hypothetical protein [Alysiella filiformis]QMT31659.1 hypothetical protein H3L97_01760 [Alysiella filiformis]UBQ55331.1 hypothetical protein JF568_06915 [Alysiella filiformis DSM 16848]SOD72037.1 hypothetical protein SAMN02746062_02183 [Alysiella filiformis DSM 16848]